MNSSKCKSGISLTDGSDKHEIILLEIIFSISICTVIIPCSLQIAIIVKTSQFKVVSTYLALNLAISDLCLVILGNIPYTYMLANKIPCELEIFIDLTRILFFYISKFLVVSLSYDRYLIIRNPNRYSQILTTKKVRIIQLLCCIAALLSTLLWGINYSIFHWTAPLLLFPSFLTIIIAVTYYYVRSIKLLNEHKARRTIFSQNNRDIAKLAKYILLTFGVFHFTSVGTVVINMITNTQYSQFIFLLNHCYLTQYSLMNAICFFRVNRQSKRCIRNFFVTHIRPNRVRNGNRP